MRAGLSVFSAVALTLCASASILGSPLAPHSGPVRRDEELQARDAAAFASLPEAVRAELAKRSPSEFEVFADDADEEGELLARSFGRDDDERGLQRRGDFPPPNYNRRMVAGGPAHDNYPNWINGNGPSTYSNCKEGQAHTFDDGPWVDHIPLTNEYRDRGHGITFFVNGNNFDCIYSEASVKRLRHSFARGALIGSHSWSHPNFTSGLTAKQIDRQIELVEVALFKILGVIPKYIRMPYGESNDTVKAYLKKRWSLSIVGWDLSSGDADGVPPNQSIDLYSHLQRGERHLMLNHETHNTTVYQVVPKALEFAKQRGIKLLDVHTCVKRKGSPYKVVAKPQKRDHTWTCAGTPPPGKLEP